MKIFRACGLIAEMKYDSCGSKTATVTIFPGKTFRVSAAGINILGKNAVRVDPGLIIKGVQYN